jgi:hypothetical protein
MRQSKDESIRIRSFILASHQKPFPLLTTDYWLPASFYVAGQHYTFSSRAMIPVRATNPYK